MEQYTTKEIQMPTLEELLAESIRLDNEKKRINEERDRLGAQQLEINSLIIQAKREKELEKIQLIIIEKVEHNIIYIDTNGSPRSDILEILRTTPSRYYNYINTRNEINIQYWNNFIERINKCPNIQLTYLDKNKELLETYFTEKLFKVSKNEKVIVIHTARRNLDASRKLSKIPSAVHNTQLKAFTVPFSEGWRVIQILPLGDDVEYENDVLELIEKQVAQRQKMDEVALNNNADIPNPFTGKDDNGKILELKPFQKAGVFFGMAALGIVIPEVKKVEIKPW